MTDKFDKPTGVWIDEEVTVPVMTPHFNEKEKRVEFTKEDKQIPQKTMYIDAPAKQIICGAHEYLRIDPGKSLYKCKNCDWHRIALPVSFAFDPATGILTRRATGERV